MATGTPVLVSDSAGTGKVRKIKYTWTSNASGVVTLDAIQHSGLFLGIETKPGAVTPDAYAIAVRRGGTTTAFRDLLQGSGAARSTTLPEYAHAEDGNGNAVAVSLRQDDLYVCITGAGASKTGEFTIDLINE